MSAAVSAKNKYSVKNGYRPSSKTPWGNPAVYFFSLVLVAICVAPVLYYHLWWFPYQFADY